MAASAAAEALRRGRSRAEDETDDPAAGEFFIEVEEREAAEGGLAATAANLALVDEMLALARKGERQHLIDQREVSGARGERAGRLGGFRFPRPR